MPDGKLGAFVGFSEEILFRVEQVTSILIVDLCSFQKNFGQGFLSKKSSTMMVLKSKYSGAHV